MKPSGSTPPGTRVGSRIRRETGAARHVLRFATIAALTVAIVAPGSIAPGDATSALGPTTAGRDTVTYWDGRLSVSVSNVSLAELIEHIGARAGFQVERVDNMAGPKTSWAIASLPPAEAVEQAARVSSMVTGPTTGYAAPAELKTVEPTLANQLLIDAITRSSVQDRLDAVDRLAGRSDDISIANLSFALQHDPDASVRARAVRVLESLHGPRAASALEPGLGDDASSVRIDVVRALGKLADERMPLWLGQVIMGDPSDAVRLEAVRAIAAQPNAMARHFLAAAANDPSAAVRRAAAGLLGESD